MYVETKHEGEPQVKETEMWRQQLLDAADRLEVNGWCKGMMYDHRGRSCALGALWLTLRRHDCRDDNSFPDVVGVTVYMPRPLVELAARVECYLARTYKGHKHLHLTPGFNIARWNDAKHRTKKQVLRALREAARA